MLHALQKRTPFKWELGACTVDPQTEGFDPSPLKAYLARLGVPYFYEEAPRIATASSESTPSSASEGADSASSSSHAGAWARSTAATDAGSAAADCLRERDGGGGAGKGGCDLYAIWAIYAIYATWRSGCDLDAIS